MLRLIRKLKLIIQNFMKKTIISITLNLLCFSEITFSQVPKKTVVEHFTNTKCSICASKNPGFYANLNNQTNTLYLSIHPSSPYNGCLLYQQNAFANDSRTNYYGIYGGTPRLVINGNVIAASANYASSSIFVPYQSLTSPVSIRIVQEKFGNDSIRAVVIIKTEVINSLGNLSLFVALAEDTVFYTGSNGEPKHYNVFRKPLSNTTGNIITLAPTVGDSVVFMFSAPSNTNWDFSRIYTIAILQESATKNLVQAEAVPATAGVISTGISHPTKANNSLVYPNPAKNTLTVTLQVSSGVISIHNLMGKLMIQKEISKTNSQIDITELPNGIYFLTIKSNGQITTQKIVKQ